MKKKLKIKNDKKNLTIILKYLFNSAALDIIC